MAEETPEKTPSQTEVNIEDIAAALDASPTIKASELISNEQQIPDNISSVDKEVLTQQEDINPSPNTVDAAIIETNTTHSELQRKINLAQAAGIGQSSSEYPDDIRPRGHDLTTTIPAGFPNEMDTEKLPPNMGGAVPAPSRGIASLRSTSADIKSGGNRYGFS